MKGIKDILIQHPFFKDLKENYIELIANCGINKVFEPGQLLGHEGTSADYFFIVRSGKVAIQMYSPNKGSITLQTIGSDEIIGWSWLFPPYKWCFDIRAIETTKAIALDGKCLRTKCDENHELGYQLMKRFSEIMVLRLQATRMQILDIYQEIHT